MLECEIFMLTSKKLMLELLRYVVLNSRLEGQFTGTWMWKDLPHLFYGMCIINVYPYAFGDVSLFINVSLLFHHNLSL